MLRRPHYSPFYLHKKGNVRDTDCPVFIWVNIFPQSRKSDAAVSNLEYREIVDCG